eukprot:s3198_g10.t1
MLNLCFAASGFYVKLARSITILSWEDLHLMGIHNELHRRRVMLELRHLYGPEGWEEALHGLNPEQLVHPTALPPALDVAPPVAPLPMAPPPSPAASAARPRSPYLSSQRRRAERMPKAASPRAAAVATPRRLGVEERVAAAASLQGMRPVDFEAALLRALPGALEKLGFGDRNARLPPCRHGRTGASR